MKYLGSENFGNLKVIHMNLSSFKSVKMCIFKIMQSFEALNIGKISPQNPRRYGLRASKYAVKIVLNFCLFLLF